MWAIIESWGLDGSPPFLSEITSYPALALECIAVYKGVPFKGTGVALIEGLSSQHTNVTLFRPLNQDRLDSETLHGDLLEAEKEAWIA